MSTARIGALYRYPVKGFTPHEVGHLHLADVGRPAGDRVWSLRFDAGTRPQEREGLDYWPKGDGLCLRDHPGLARLRVRADYAGDDDHTVDALTVHYPAGTPRTYALPGDGPALERDVMEFLGSHEGGGIRLRAGQERVSLVGDGHTPRFQDRPRGFVTAHNRASLRELEHVMGTGVDERRFRSNIAIDGWEPWQERDLIGEHVDIDGVEFLVEAPIVRCLAINANPDTGARDVRVLQTLTRGVGGAASQDRPVFGVLLTPAPSRKGGRISVGAPVRLAG